MSFVNRTSERTSDTFEDLVIKVSGDIFAEALGQKVADALLHNFMIRDPSIRDDGVDRIAIFQKLLKESFGEFYVKILEIIFEHVCLRSGIIYSDFAGRPISELLQKAEEAYRSQEASKSAQSA